MDGKHQDYLFDLQGYLILKGAIPREDLDEMNRWVDDHWPRVESALGQSDLADADRWIGHVEIHSYGQNDGVNFQNIIEAGPAFERLIDSPAWMPLVVKYINPVNGVSIHVF